MIKTSSIKDLFETLNKQMETTKISYGISDSYVPNWDEKQALTEYVANFYDENQTDFTITELSDGIVLEDRSVRGILPSDLAVGNSRSREKSYKIGTHGEGFKLGALVLARNGKRVIIETIGHTILFFLEEDVKLKSNILKSKIYSNERQIGSKIFLETDSLQEVKERFLFLNNHLEQINDVLYRQTNHKASNYIYVNTLASQSIQSFFSYSLHKKQTVNRDRNMIESPYTDLLVAIFSMTDKKIIKEWLLCMTKEGFRGSFEYELIHYFDSHQKRKVFKELDLTLFRTCAKELGLQYIGHLERDYQSAYQLAQPEKPLITVDNYNITHFCEKHLQIPMKSTGLHLGFKKDGHYHLPILRNQCEHLPSYEVILSLYNGLDSSAVLKEASLEGDTLTFTLKPKAEEKIHYLFMWVSNKNSHIRIAFNALYSLLNHNHIQWSGIAFDKTTINEFPYLLLKCIPTTFQLHIKEPTLLQELKKNILYSNAKSIVKNKIFDTKDGATYQIDTSFQLGDKINACYSYYSDMESEYTAFCCPTVVRTFLERIKENPNRDDLYEFTMISKITSNTHRYAYRTKQNTLKRVLADQFLKVFGSKTVISCSEEGDKKARYNHYRVLTVSPVLKNYFTLLKTNLSDYVKGLNDTDFEIILKPSMECLDTTLESVYKQSVAASLSLYKTLVYLYESTKDIQNHFQRKELQALLPYGHSANSILPFVNEQPMNNVNYKKMIKEYCFEIYEHTHIVHSFDKPTINGLVAKNQIFIKEPFNLGTFFHEYIHLSTDLLDIDESFEKTLSFMNVLSHRFQHPSEKEVRNYFNEYKKWLGVL